MVLSFFRGGGDSTLEHIEAEIGSMLGDCRHSFDLAMGALVTDADVGPIGEEVRATDRRINGIEETVRRELVVHTSVQGGADVALVLSFLLVVKKLERVGDQAKNVFDLAAEGVRFSGAGDYERFVELRNEVSGLMGEAAAILSSADEGEPAGFIERCQVLMDDLDANVNRLMHSDEPARHAVPRAMLFRYCKRIIANISGVVTILIRPLDRRDIDE
jgi:phosphate uptake regulator